MLFRSFQEIRIRLSDNFYDIGRDLRSFAIWFISSLPYLIIWAVIIVIVVRLVRKLIWKKPFFGRKRKQRKEEMEKMQSKEEGKSQEQEKDLE